MNLQNRTINRILGVSLAALFFSVYGYVMLAFLHPLPLIAPSEVGDDIFISDTLPRNCRIIGIDVTFDNHIYLHGEHQTLCFDKNGDYLGRFVYSSKGATFFKPVESSSCFWIYYDQSGDKYLCDSKGIVLQTVEMTENEYVGNREYKQKAADSGGNVYRVQKLLCFSRVTGPDGHTFYDQSVIFKADCVLIMLSAVFTVVFGLLKIKKQIGDESLIDWAIRGGFFREAIDSIKGRSGDASNQSGDSTMIDG